MEKIRRAVTQGKMESCRILKTFRLSEIAKTAGISVGISTIIAFLFYNSFWGFISVLAVFPIVIWRMGAEKEKKRKKKLNLEFKDYLYAVAGALIAGYSIENAFREALKEVKQLYGTDAILVGELDSLEKRLAVQDPLERILKDFAAKSKCEDIENFVEVFCYAKRGGGDFIKIIQTTVNRICDKIEVSTEIDTVLAEKALEQKVMSVIPIGMLVFFRFSNPEFIEVLYGNYWGIVFMSIALLVYGLAFFMANKIVEIEV